MHDIVDTAVAAGSFKTLVAAVTAAGLVDTLKGAGPFTVFAPSDDAFAKLPAGTVDTLVKPENKEKLTKILTLHVIPSKVMAADVAGKKMSPASVSGEALDVDGTTGVVVSGATVTKADIECSNGVIHVIDTVIMPKGWLASPDERQGAAFTGRRIDFSQPRNKLRRGLFSDRSLCSGISRALDMGASSRAWAPRIS